MEGNDNLADQILSRPASLSVAGRPLASRPHRLLCGDARSEGDVGRLMGAKADLNCRSSLQRRRRQCRWTWRHRREFAFASGE